MGRPFRTVGTKLLCRAIRSLGIALYFGQIFLPLPAAANCVVGAASTTCDVLSPNPYGIGIGNGPRTASPYQVILPTGARINVTDSNAISLHDNAAVNIQSGAVVQTTTTTCRRQSGSVWDR
jgi:hypothetical protein